MKRGFLKKAPNTTSTRIKIVPTLKGPQYELIPILEIKIPDYSYVPLQGVFPTENFNFSLITSPTALCFSSYGMSRRMPPLSWKGTYTSLT